MIVPAIVKQVADGTFRNVLIVRYDGKVIGTHQETTHGMVTELEYIVKEMSILGNGFSDILKKSITNYGMKLIREY